MNNQLDIQKIKKHALNRGGKCLSDHFENAKTKLVWQCEKGHQWESIIQSVVGSDSWCPVCAKNIRLTIEEMQVIAEERGGECLSAEYINTNTKLLWKCVHGHQWESTPLSIKNRKSWCPYCANNRAFTIKDMHILAKQLGGKCLSTEYVNVKTNLFWQCENGHTWESSADNVKQGRWCPHCKIIEKKDNYEKFKNESI